MNIAIQLTPTALPNVTVDSGGAERLVVDAAVGLKERGHQVIMYTSHHDKNHCFEETRDGTVPVICI